MKFDEHPNFQVDAIKEILDQLVGGAENILGDNFVGAWLQGSSATGHFDEHSDIDFVIGVKRDLTREELSSLQKFHQQLYNYESHWSKHLEGSYIPMSILRESRFAGEKVWYLDHGSTNFERSAHDNSVAVKWILREKGVVLAGPDPSEIMDPITVFELRKDIYQTFADWAELIIDNPDEISSHFYQSFAVLSYCRMLNDIRCGSVGSKRDGAEWVKAHLDPMWGDLIDKAWLGRHNPALSVKRPADQEDVRRTVEFIQVILEVARQFMISFGLDPTTVLDET
jgi:hypothetical protein